jgi:tRNA-dihydrouridine synthase
MIIGQKKIWPPLLLAPMAGLTHSALRTTILTFGGVGLLSTEMLAAARLPAESDQHSPYLLRTPQELPLSYQLLLTEERKIPLVFAALHRLKADVIDLNLGCPAPLVRKTGGGSSLMDDPERVRRIVSCARKNTVLPLTAKIRLGETLDMSKLKDFCLMLAGEGIDMLTVHARLRSESFARPPRWKWIAQVKDWINIPVVANGSIDSIASARTCLEECGADGLMIGRAAARTPWIFAVLARDLYQMDIPEPDVCLPQLYRQFTRALVERFPPERRLGRLKEYTHYFAKNYFFGHHLASKVQASSSLETAWARAMEFFGANDPCGIPGLESPFAVNGQDPEVDCSNQNPEPGISFSASPARW